jgi:hypothetical protein
VHWNFLFAGTQFFPTLCLREKGQLNSTMQTRSMPLDFPEEWVQGRLNFRTFFGDSNTSKADSPFKWQQGTSSSKRTGNRFSSSKKAKKGKEKDFI